MKSYRICTLPGDGIGPEVLSEGVKVLAGAAARCAFELELVPALIGGAAFDATGEMLPEASVRACRDSDAVLLGAVGGPKWDHLSGNERPESALLGIREALGLFANLRPARLYDALRSACPLREELLAQGMDILIVRELTGGIYFGRRGRGFNAGAGEFAFDTEYYSRAEIERIARVAFEAARLRRKRLCSVDKANVLESSKLWRETVTRVAEDFPEVELSHLYVDNASMQLIRRPGDFDVLLSSNMFGDILSDEAAELTGSIGLLPSASLGAGKPALFEPIHGSAPDIAGRDLANPLATILSAAMLCRYALREEEAARLIEAAVEAVLNAGFRCADLRAQEGAGPEKTLGCRAMGDKVLAALDGLAG